MASAVSYEYLKQIQGAAFGLATLDANSKIDPAQLPDIVTLFKGVFGTADLLRAAFPTSSIACYAYVTATNSFWYWNPQLTDHDPVDPQPAADWVNQEISEEDYTNLTDEEKAMVPYLVVPPLYVPAP